MTSQVLPDAPVRTHRDLRTLGRVVSAILMPIGPAFVAVIRLVLPGASGDIGAEVAANPGAMRLALLLGIPAWFALLPGAYAAVHLGRRYLPALTAWTAACLIPGYLGMAALGATDYAVLAAHDIGLDPATVTQLADAIGGLTIVEVLVFVLGHIIGMVLLGILAYRARLTPRWVAVLLLISQPLHFAAVILANPWLDFVAWGLTALGMGFLGVRVLHTANDEWDLPARGAGSVPGKELSVTRLAG